MQIKLLIIPGICLSMIQQFICYCSYFLMELVSFFSTYICTIINSLSLIIYKLYALAQVHTYMYICVRLKCITDVKQSSVSSAFSSSLISSQNSSSIYSQSSALSSSVSSSQSSALIQFLISSLSSFLRSFLSSSFSYFLNSTLSSSFKQLQIQYFLRYFF